MTWNLSQSGTSAQKVSATCTCTNGSPGVVTFTNTFAAGDMFFFSGTTAPTGTSLFKPYFVSATSLSSSSFQFSATLGGSSVNTTSTGTALVCNPIQVLGVPDVNNATFVLDADLSNMAMGDLVSLYLFGITLSGGVASQIWKGTWQHLQINPHKISPPVASDQSITVAILQAAGTARAFPWKLLRL